MSLTSLTKTERSKKDWLSSSFDVGMLSIAASLAQSKTEFKSSKTFLSGKKERNLVE